MSQYNPPPPYPQPQPVLAQKSSGQAIAAMVCGLIGLVLAPVGIVGIILGAVALSKRKHPDEPGKGFAITGIVAGSLGLILCGPAILLPSLNRAREAANKIKCASNMKQIGLAIRMYANDDFRGGNRFPPDLAHLVTTQEITTDAFVCPSSGESRGTGTTLAQLQTELKHGSGCCSYIYVPGFTDNASGDTVVLYEPLTNHDGDGANVLYADGHVDWLVADKVKAMIADIQAGQNPPR